jgi:hypothetical protein
MMWTIQKINVVMKETNKWIIGCDSSNSAVDSKMTRNGR